MKQSAAIAKRLGLKSDPIAGSRAIEMSGLEPKSMLEGILMILHDKLISQCAVNWQWLMLQLLIFTSP